MTKEESQEAARTAEIALLQNHLNNKGWRLGFKGQMEKDFQYAYSKRYMLHIQIAAVLGLVALTIPGFIANWLTPDVAGKSWQIQMVASGLLLLSLCFSTMEFALRLAQPFIALNSTVIFTAVLLVSEHQHYPYNHFYANAMSVVILVVFVLSRLQFFWGVITALLMLIALTAHLLVLTPNASLDLITLQYFVFLTAVGFALPGTYLIERALRTNYLQSQLLGLEQKGLEETNLNLEILTATDGLTHIANRRSFDRALEREWSRQTRTESPLSLLMLDVDYFKKFNDHYGHQRGDECLRQVAKAIEQFARRPGDLAARYGGEEFALILPNSRPEDAMGIARQIVEAVAALHLPHADSPLGHVTTSVGIATMIPMPDIGPEQIIMRADEALYKAKRGGRNRATAYDFEARS